MYGPFDRRDPKSHWRPDPTPPPEPLTPEPPVAAYPVRKCLFCDEYTTREACPKCQACHLAPMGVKDKPTLGELRLRVHDGQLTDWPDEALGGWTHNELQTNWQCRAAKAHLAASIIHGLIHRALTRYFGHPRLHQARPWFFHPEDFTTEEAA